MSFPQQDALHGSSLDDDPNHSFDASSYINDDGDSPGPFDKLETDPLSSETDSAVQDIMQDMNGESDMNGDSGLDHFLHHSSSGNPGDITFVSGDMVGSGSAFSAGLNGLTPGMDMNDVGALDRDYGLGVDMRTIGSQHIDSGMRGGIDGPPNRHAETLPTADMTPRASKVAAKIGTRSADQQRYAAAMQQHHHVSSTTYTAPLLSGRTDDGVFPAGLPPPTASYDNAQRMTTPASDQHARSGLTEMAPSPIFSHVNVKREPSEAGMNDFRASDAEAHALTGMPLHIQSFDRFETEDGGEDEDDELANESGANGMQEHQDGQSAGERTSESSVEEVKAKKRKGKGKEKESSSGLEVDETDTGINPELDAAGDGDGDVDGDDENARRKIKIEYIEDKSRRHITFSKRKAGIMKKAYELSILTGTQVLLLVVSETGLCYTYTTPKMSPMVTQPAGQQLIQACLNAPEGYGPDGEVLRVPSAPSGSKKDKNELAIRPLKLNAEELANLAAASASASDPTTPKKKKQGKPTLEGKEGKPGGAAAAQNRRRASDKVKRAASGAAKKSARVTSEGNPATSSRPFNEHDMDTFQPPPPIPPIPVNMRRNPSSNPPSADTNGTNAPLSMQRNMQPDIQPGVALVSPVSAVYPSSHHLPPQQHQPLHHAQQNEYSEYHMHQAQSTGPHYYQAQAMSQPPPNGMAVQINYSYPTPAGQFLDHSQGNAALHSQQMQRRQSQHQSMPQPPHSADSHSNPHQQYIQSLPESQHYSTTQPHPGQMVAGPIVMGQM